MIYGLQGNQNVIEFLANDIEFEQIDFNLNQYSNLEKDFPTIDEQYVMNSGCIYANLLKLVLHILVAGILVLLMATTVDDNDKIIQVAFIIVEVECEPT